MPAQLLTQELTDDPQVLVIKDNSVLSDLVVSILENTSFEIKKINLEDSSFVQQLGDLGDKKFFKIVWVNNLVGDRPIKHTQILLEFLQKRVCQQVFVFSVTSKIKSQDQLLTSWTELSEWQDNFLGALKRHLPQALWVLVQDLSLDTNHLSYPWSGLFSILHQGQVVDPQVALSPLQIGDLKAPLKKTLFSPWTGQQILIKGQTIGSTELIKKIVRLYRQIFNRELLITPTQETQSSPIEASHEWVLENNVDELCFQLSKFMPQIKDNQADDETKAEIKPSKDTPQITPVASRPVVKKTPQPLRVKSLEKKMASQVKKQQPRVISDREKELLQELETTAQKVFGHQRLEKKIKRVEKKVEKTQSIKTKQKRKKAAFVVGMFWLGAVLAFLILAGFFYLNFEWVKKDSNRILTSLGMTNQPLVTQVGSSNSNWVRLLDIQQSAYQSLVKLDFFETVGNEVEINQALRESQKLLASQNSSIGLAFQQIMGQESGSGVETLNSIQMSIDQLYQKLSIIHAQLKNDHRNENELETIEKRLTELRKSLIVGEQLMPVLPSLLGHEGRKNYLVLLQDSQELRPTGGFIQAAAILTFDKEGLINTEVMSVYQLDSLLRGDFTPPTDLKNLLGESNWYLRDSNWSPDFSQVSQVSQKFVHSSLNKKIDGVIALNLYSLQPMLAAVGPLEVAEYSEILTERNLFERFEAHSEIQVVERLDKENYPTLVLRLFVERLKQLSPDQTSDLLAALFGALQEKQLFISASDSSLDQTFDILGWNGTLLSPNCPAQFESEFCQVDSIMEVETNYGVNKANVGVERNIHHQIDLSPTRADHTRTIVLSNNNQSNAWPLGSYQLYLRFLVDKVAVFDSLSIDDEVYKQEDLISSQEKNKQVWGIATQIPVKTSQKIVLKYHRQFDNLSAYTFFDQKQAGLEDNFSRVEIVLSPSLIAQTIAPQAQVQGQRISFTPLSEGHSFVGVSLSK